MGGENIIYDRSSDALFIYDPGAPVIYQFTVAQYQDDFLDDGGHDSHWAHVETITQAQPPMFGLEVEQVRYWDEPDEDKNTAEMLYWVSSELPSRSEEHTSELQSRGHLVCRLLLEKK